MTSGRMQASKFGSRPRKTGARPGCCFSEGQGGLVTERWIAKFEKPRLKALSDLKKRLEKSDG
jgi:hypothetical protein